MNIVEGDRPDLSDGTLEVMLDEGAMALLGWSLGESHSIMLNGVEQEVVIVGVTRGGISSNDVLHEGGFGWCDGDQCHLCLPPTKDGIEVDPTLAEISIGVVERNTLIDGMNSLIDQQTQIFTAMMYLGLIFTIAVMFNTMIMNVAERDFELACLRVLGGSTASLGIMLLFESLLIGFVGGIVGVAFAYGGAVGLAASFSSWQFYVTILIVPSVAYQLMAGVVVIAIGMTPIGIWRLRRMDLVDKVKNLTQ